VAAGGHTDIWRARVIRRAGGRRWRGDIDLVGGETILFIVGQKGEDTFVALDNAAPGGWRRVHLSIVAQPIRHR